MAKYVQRGETIDFKNTGSMILAGAIVALTGRIGVAATQIPPGGVGSLNVIGVYDVPATSGEEYTVGQKVYFKDGKLQASATDSVEAGWVVEPKTSAGTVARIKIG